MDPAEDLDKSSKREVCNQSRKQDAKELQNLGEILACPWPRACAGQCELEREHHLSKRRVLHISHVKLLPRCQWESMFECKEKLP